MRLRFAAVAAVLILIASPVVSLASEFDWIARNVERESGCKRLHIPFFGLARFVVGVSHPGGATDLQLAVFEEPHISADRFRSIVDDAVGVNWKPMIRVHSMRSGQTTAIYGREDGRHMRFLISNLDHSDATLVQVRMNMDKLLSFIDEQRSRHSR